MAGRNEDHYHEKVLRITQPKGASVDCNVACPSGCHVRHANHRHGTLMNKPTGSDPDYSGPERRSGDERRESYLRIEDLERAIKSQNRRNYGFYFAAVLLIALVLFSYQSAANDNARVQRHLHNDELATCVVQARGLPAGHRLAMGLGALVTFLKEVIPPNAPLKPKQASALHAVEDGLGSYASIEAQQPQTRSCDTGKMGATGTTGVR